MADACRRLPCSPYSLTDSMCRRQNYLTRSRMTWPRCTLPTMAKAATRSRARDALSLRVGRRIREARTRASLTQQEVAGERYTKAYVSALENGLIRPSVAALDYLASRLGTTPG